MAFESFRQLRQYRNDLSLKEYWGTAPPSSTGDPGPFALGDVVWNTAPAPSSPVGWICTTPGADGSIAVFSPFAGNLVPLVAGATLTLGPAQQGSTILLNQATGSVVTLPPATGSGIIYRFVVTVVLTSNFNKVLPGNVADFIIGTALTQVAAGTVTGFQSPLATNHSIRENGTTTGSAGVGESWQLQDIGANLWEATGSTFSSGAVATPFNVATS